MSEQAVLTGEHFMNGDDACAEGALAAGCRFFGGYPITPATEIAERMAARLPKCGGVFIQMEDELAAIGAVIGAAWGGKKSMTATSGPGFSLMMENLGLALMTETPCVIANVQRGGPSTGLPTMVGQQDMMQARWGSHGDYEIIALCPNSPQEMFNLTIEAFNLSERLRLPVLVMADATVAHMVERVTIPAADEIYIVDRALAESKEGWLPFHAEADGVPAMAHFGEGYCQHVTGLTHDERGYPALTVEAQEHLVSRLVGKVRSRAQELTMIERTMMEDAQVAVVAYGITSRVAQRAVRLARAQGCRAGLLRLQMAWPFPDHAIAALAEQVDAILVPEINMGQMVREVQRAAEGRCAVIGQPHAGGAIPEPGEILNGLLELARRPAARTRA